MTDKLKRHFHMVHDHQLFITIREIKQISSNSIFSLISFACPHFINIVLKINPKGVNGKYDDLPENCYVAPTFYDQGIPRPETETVWSFQAKAKLSIMVLSLLVLLPVKKRKDQYIVYKY